MTLIYLISNNCALNIMIYEKINKVRLPLNGKLKFRIILQTSNKLKKNL